MRLRATLSINFYCRKAKANKRGVAPVELAVNIDGERFFVNLPRKCRPGDLGKIRDYTSALEGRIRDYEMWCLTRRKKITVQGVKEFIRNGWSCPSGDLGQVLKDFYGYVDSKPISATVRRKYRLAMNNFMSMTGLTADTPLDEITPGVVRVFVDKMTAAYKNSTLQGMLTRFKMFLGWCVDNRLLDTNPWNGMRIRREEVKIETIDNDEYGRIKALDLSWCERLEKVRDLFIFSCNTGLAYTDVSRLLPGDFKTNAQGQVFISKERAKTGINYTVVVLPDALEVAGKYGYELPEISNQKCNSYLKEIQDLAKVGSVLTFHKARHFYARRLLNDFHFSLEVVARCLGHSSTTQTKHYAKIFSSTVFDEFRSRGY